MRVSSTKSTTDFIKNPLKNVNVRSLLGAARAKYWSSIILGQVEDNYRLKYMAVLPPQRANLITPASKLGKAAPHRRRLEILVSYYRDFPEDARVSQWAEEEAIKLWRMGDADSARALVRIVKYRCRKRRPMRERMRTARIAVQLSAFDQVNPELVSAYASIKQWVANKRKEEPAISRKELWECWNRAGMVQPSNPPIIDRAHFKKLAARASKQRHHTPGYLARSYLCKLLRLSEHLASHKYARPNDEKLRILSGPFEPRPQQLPPSN